MKLKLLTAMVVLRGLDIESGESNGIGDVSWVCTGCIALYRH